MDILNIVLSPISPLYYFPPSFSLQYADFSLFHPFILYRTDAERPTGNKTVFKQVCDFGCDFITNYGSLTHCLTFLDLIVLICISGANIE